MTEKEKRELRRLADEYIDAHVEDLINDIGELVAIPSVRSEAADGAPFGSECAAAAGFAADWLGRLGFDAVNHENYAVDCTLGSAPERLGILAHLDVVAAGDGWTKTEPFAMRREGDTLWGRGVSDDKGPAACAAWALKAVASLGREPARGVRLILGCAEETGSEDLEYYFARRDCPEMVFSPDADYPLINIEKGRFAPEFGADYDEAKNAALPCRLDSFHGGTVSNAAPGRASCRVTGVTEAECRSKCGLISDLSGVDFETEADGDGIVITASGVSAHASTPQVGKNAQTALLAVVSMLPLSAGQVKRAVDSLATLFPVGDVNGERLGLVCEDESGKLTCSFDILRIENGSIRALCDVRIPARADSEAVVEKIGFKLRGHGLRRFDDSEPSAPHVVEPDSELVKTLLAIYTDYTGEPGKAGATGGGTYVHEIEGGVAFGCQMPGTDTKMHGPDEFQTVPTLVMSAKMFAAAIIELCF